MTVRDVIEIAAKAIDPLAWVVPKGDYPAERARRDAKKQTSLQQARFALSALRAAGYSIIHDSENHGPTVERAAGAYEAHDKNGRDWIPGSLWDTLVREGTSRIRTLTRCGNE